MGAAERKGPSKNYLTLVAGDPATADVFDGVDVSWNRLPGGSAVGQILARRRVLSRPGPEQDDSAAAEGAPFDLEGRGGSGAALAEPKLRSWMKRSPLAPPLAGCDLGPLHGHSRIEPASYGSQLSTGRNFR